MCFELIVPLDSIRNLIIESTRQEEILDVVSELDTSASRRGPEHKSPIGCLVLRGYSAAF